MDDLFSLDGKVALVTGAGSGLGHSISAVLARHGARVMLLDRDRTALEKACAALGGSAQACPVDVADRAALREVIDRCAAEHGRLDIAVANAGISAGPGYNTPEGRLEKVEDARWDEVLAVNLTGAFATAQAAARHMRRQRSGRIIVVSSIAGLRAEAMCGYAYAASKAAVINLVRQLAMDLAGDNILVNGIAPGPFRTNIAGGRIRQPDIEAQFAAMVPLGRIAEPEEIQGLALLLASEAASFMTGVTIPIDGGATAR